MKGRSIYIRLFTAIMALFTVSYIVTGTLLFGFVGNYFVKRHERELDDIASQAVDITVYMAKNNQKTSAEAYHMNISAIAEATDTEIIVIDEHGRVVTSSMEAFEITVEEDRIRDLLKGERETFRGTLDGVYKSDMLTVAKPIVYMDKVVGGVLVSVPTPEIARMRMEVLKIFILNVLCVAVFVAFFVYFISKRITKPLSQLNEVAKSIAGGNFKKRVSIDAENELSELGQTFNDMAESIEQLENMRSSFIANVSHDLRTPMTTIIGFVEGILDGTIPEEKHQWYLSIVLDESKRLSRIVTDLLDLSKLEQGSFHIEKREFDMNELIRLSIIKFEKRITEKNISLTVDFEGESLRVNADKDAIQRVITNLFDNAIKFTPENGFIDIHTGTKGERGFVSVQNSGAGIDEKDLKHIFDRFYKSDKSRSRDKIGAGLGLYIVKSIMNAHGESIWAESAPEHYTRFSFTLQKINEKK